MASTIDLTELNNQVNLPNDKEDKSTDKQVDVTLGLWH